MVPSTWLRLAGLSGLLILLSVAGPALSQAPKGKKYALLVGVRIYEHRKLTDLKYTENDAEATASVLTKAKYDEVVVLTTSRGEKDAKAKPTKANIEAQLKRLLKKVTKDDVVLVGLAGHGVQYEVKQDGKRRDESFFCPADAKLIDSDDFDRLAATMLSFRDLFKQLDDSGAGSRLLLIDACRNDPGSSRNADTDAMPRPTKGTAALFACKGGERAFESDKLGKGHGVFFFHVIEALEGKAKNDDGEVSWDDLTRHVRRAVVKSVPELIRGGARQTPHLMANVEGDPVLLRVGKAAVVKKEEKEKKEKGKDVKEVKDLDLPFKATWDTKAIQTYFVILKVSYDDEKNQVIWLVQAKRALRQVAIETMLRVDFYDADDTRLHRTMHKAPGVADPLDYNPAFQVKKGDRLRVILPLPKQDILKKTTRVVFEDGNK